MSLAASRKLAETEHIITELKNVFELDEDNKKVTAIKEEVERMQEVCSEQQRELLETIQQMTSLRDEEKRKCEGGISEEEHKQRMEDMIEKLEQIKNDMDGLVLRENVAKESEIHLEDAERKLTDRDDYVEDVHTSEKEVVLHSLKVLDSVFSLRWEYNVDDVSCRVRNEGEKAVKLLHYDPSELNKVDLADKLWEDIENVIS